MSRAGSSADASEVTYDSHDALLSVLIREAIKWRLPVYLTGWEIQTCVRVRDGSRLPWDVAAPAFCLSALPDLSGCLPLTCMCTYVSTWVPNRLNCAVSSLCEAEGRCIISEPWNSRSAVLSKPPFFLFHPVFSSFTRVLLHTPVDCRHCFFSHSVIFDCAVAATTAIFWKKHKMRKQLQMHISYIYRAASLSILYLSLSSTLHRQPGTHFSWHLFSI